MSKTYGACAKCGHPFQWEDVRVTIPDGKSSTYCVPKCISHEEMFKHD